MDLAIIDSYLGHTKNYDDDVKGDELVLVVDVNLFLQKLLWLVNYIKSFLSSETFYFSFICSVVCLTNSPLHGTSRKQCYSAGCVLLKLMKTYVC